jgi:hypothetical protein
MHGFRNLPPTGGMREMFEQKWAKMGLQGFSGGTGATPRGYSVIAHYRRWSRYE